MPAPAPSPLVTVTGASGFIALHCVQRLLTDGYRVRGTLRRLDRAPTLRAALTLTPEADARLEFCAADLVADAGWDEALAGSTFVLHTASPVPAWQPRHEDDVVVPARDGTLRVLRAAADAGVRRVVVTSSVAAVCSGVERGPHRTFAEDDWSDLGSHMPAYSRSKTLAERAAWAYVANLPSARRFELATINPSFVLGPSLTGGANASNEIVRRLVARGLPGVPRLLFHLVDVRDVADLHVRAMKSAAAAGRRFIATTEGWWYAEIARALAEADIAVPTRVVPDWVVRLLGLVDPTVRLVVGDLGREYHLSSARARQELGWSPRGVRETLVDTARAIVAHRAGRGAPPSGGLT